jgi:DNA (cytosine-5)-methyltransferase 1
LNSKAERFYTVAELFCGCGGLSHGFKRTRRFNIVFGNDLKKAALKTFVANSAGAHGAPEIVDDDIRRALIEDIESALKRKGVGPGELDCLVGGPPCQGFSQMRRSEERLDSELVRFKGYNRLDEDPRNDLVLRFLEIANALRPKFILIENVPQMRSHTHNGTQGGLLENVRELLEGMGYTAPSIGTLNAADFGVPQLRERLFIVASRVCRAVLPMPTHANPDTKDFLSRGLAPWNTVQDAIGDLPRPPIGPNDKLGGGPLDLYRPAPKVSSYVTEMRSVSAFPYNHLSRRYSREILSTIKEMKRGETWDSASERKRAEYEPVIQKLMQEGNTRVKAIKELVSRGVINRKFLNRYYWSAYTRLNWKRPALTITANANFLGSGRFTHPKEHRGITMREAARLQSFEDDFKFITSGVDETDTATVGVGLDMIGEAVPPLLAASFAKQMAAQLDSHYAVESEQIEELAPRVVLSEAAQV